MENVKKLGRDLLVLVVASLAFYVSENVADLGLPDEIAPAVGALALYAYRTLRTRVRDTS